MSNSASIKVNTAEYVWKFPGSPVRIHIALDVIARMREQLNLQRAPESEGACELGGLLLGRVETSRVYVTGFEPFEVEPGQQHFVLSETQRSRLEKVIAGRGGKINTTA